MRRRSFVFPCLGTHLAGVTAVAGAMMLGSMLIAGVADAQGLDVEFQINQETTGDQDHPTVATDTAGNFLVVWNSRVGGDGTGIDISGRSFDREGNPLTDEFRVNETIVGNQSNPDVATDRNGSFAIVWSSDMGDDHHADARMITLDGEPISGETRISTASADQKIRPDVAMYPNGDSIAIWAQVTGSEYTYFATLYDSLLLPLGGPWQLNVSESNCPLAACRNGLPDIDGNDAGDTAAVFGIFSPDRAAIVGRLTDPYDVTASPEMEIDPPMPGRVQRRPMVDINNAGDVLVTWVEQDSDVRARRFDGDTRIWSEVISPTVEPGNYAVPKLTEAGDFVVSWSSRAQSPELADIYVRFYDADAVPRTDPEVVNTTLADRQLRPSLDLFEDGDENRVVVIWESFEQDGSDWGVYGKILAFPRVAEVSFDDSGQLARPSAASAAASPLTKDSSVHW